MQLLGFQGIAADQLAEAVGLVCRGSLVRAHLVEDHVRSRFSGLKRSLATGQAGANDLYYVQSLF